MHQGFVYRFAAGSETVSAPITLGPSPDMGFVDSNGATAGCYPNQLYALALDGSRLYVAGLCASPRGPAAPGASDPTANVKTKVQTVLYEISTTSNTEIPAHKVHLNRAWTDEYGTRGTADDSSRRYPLITKSMAFAPNTHVLYLAAEGSDAVFRLEFNADGSVRQLGSGFNPFIPLNGGATNGQLPYGIALVGGNALVVNDATRNVSVIDLGTQSVEAAIPSATALDTTDEDAVSFVEGRRFFATGLGRWSLKGQGWNSCEGCHPHGLTDNVTWFFAAGPRQTTSLDGTFSPDGTQRILNWTAIFDEVGDFEANTRGISGGVGAIVHDATAPVDNTDRIVVDGAALVAGQIGTDTPQGGLNGAIADVLDPGVPGRDSTNAPVTARAVLDDWDDIERWIRDGVRTPRAPVLDADLVDDGHDLFLAHGCNGCHGGDDWTTSELFYTPSQLTNDATTGTLSTTTYVRGSLPTGLNPPSNAGPAPFRSGGSLQCALRAVGTFPATGNVGVAVSGVVVSERRDDMTTLAAGANGFSPPSLFGGATGAPYLHAGNARTLEELFDPAFIGHYRALSANFTPTDEEIEALVAFLLSIDDDTDAESAAVSTIDTILCE